MPVLFPSQSIFLPRARGPHKPLQPSSPPLPPRWRRAELVKGAGFGPVPSALVEKVLHAGGKPAVVADDETPEGASRRALQEGNSGRRARQRERSIKRKKNRVEPLSTAAAPSPAQTSPAQTAPAQTAPALAPAPKAGHGRRWSQEANVFPAG